MLRQVPWEKVKVEVILLELEHAGKVQDDLYDDLDGDFYGDFCFY